MRKRLPCKTRNIINTISIFLSSRKCGGTGQPVNWIAADIVRIKDGLLVEHWDVIQDEVTQEQSKSGQPIFGDKFAPKRVA